MKIFIQNVLQTDKKVLLLSAEKNGALFFSGELKGKSS